MWTRSQLSDLSDKLMLTLANFAKDNNLAIEYGGGQYGGIEAIVKLRVKRTDAAGAAAEMAEFAKYAHLVGLKPEHYNASFRHGGSAYRVTGINLGAPKFPIRVAREPDGKGFKFPELTVQMALNR